MRPKGARPGDPYFVWLTVVVLATFGVGLTHPRGIPKAELAIAASAPSSGSPAIEAPPAAPTPIERAVAPIPISLAMAVVETPQTKHAAAFAIVIDDLGGSPETSARAAALPREITLSFLPLGPHVAAQASAAHASGHEVLLHLPMEAIEEETEPGALMLMDTAATIGGKARAALALVPHAIGINNHMGSRFTGDASAVMRLAKSLRELDLIFLDSRTTNSSVAARFVRAAGLRVAEREIFIDHAGASREAVLAVLAHAETTAKAKGSIVLIAHPHPDTLAALETWLADPAERGIELVSLTEHVRRTTTTGGHVASLMRVPASAY